MKTTIFPLPWRKPESILSDDVATTLSSADYSRRSFRSSRRPGIVSAFAFVVLVATAQAWEVETIHAFRIGPSTPTAGLIRGGDSDLYGTSSGGGSSGLGSVYRITESGAVSVIASFSGGNGANPMGALLLGTNGSLYGTSSHGGAGDWGTVFELTTNGTLIALAEFDYANGAHPRCALISDDNGVMYGTTETGGSLGRGTVFKVTTNGLLTPLASFTEADGFGPVASLVRVSEGSFYGTTGGGGSGGHGTIFNVTAGGLLTTLASFAGTNGSSPRAPLTFDLNGDLFGTTYFGGINSSDGTVFKVTTNGVLTSLVFFEDTAGQYPAAGLVLGDDGDFYGTTSSGGTDGSGTVFKVTKSGQLTTIASFDIRSLGGRRPSSELLPAGPGLFYGTTVVGGSTAANNSIDSSGVVFRVTSDGSLTTLASLGSPHGVTPSTSLVLGSDGFLYGGTAYGGSNAQGTVFRLATNGALETIAEFDYNDSGMNPNWLSVWNGGGLIGTTGGYGAGSPTAGTVFRLRADGELSTLARFSVDGFSGTIPNGLVQVGSGDVYGTAWSGGSANAGTVFKLGTNGELSTLVEFNRTNGSGPNGPILNRNGEFYGTTWSGGISNSGTVFKVQASGNLLSLASFVGDNGSLPHAGLEPGSQGVFYGTTSKGGSSNLGTVFQVTSSGVLTVLNSFHGADGSDPEAALATGADGNLYGTTYLGGAAGFGTAFRATTGGVLTVLATFDGTNGANPQGRLTLDADGSFYGTTTAGGPGGGGTVFRLVNRAVLPRFTGITRQPDGSVLLDGSGPDNGAYRLWFSPIVSLPVGSWSLLESDVFDDAGSFSYTDAAGPASNSTGFYQISVP